MNNWQRLGVVSAWCASAAWAVDWKVLQPQGCVSDFAQVVDAPAKSQIESYCAAVEQSTGVRMALVTVASLQGEPIEDVANTIAGAWGVVPPVERYQAFLDIEPAGKAPRPALPPLDIVKPAKKEGILLLLAIQEHRYHLAIGRRLAPILPDGLSGSILREMRPALRQHQHGEAVMAAAETLGIAIAKAKHAVETRLPRRIRPGPWDAFPWPLAVGVVILVAWLMIAGGPRGFGWAGGRGFLPWLALGTMMGRSTWGSRGTGGFGGYDSGDGSAGFGGGDFGGAGASSDW